MHPGATGSSTFIWRMPSNTPACPAWRDAGRTPIGKCGGSWQRQPTPGSRWCPSSTFSDIRSISSTTRPCGTSMNSEPPTEVPCPRARSAPSTRACRRSPKSCCTTSSRSAPRARCTWASMNPTTWAGTRAAAGKSRGSGWPGILRVTCSACTAWHPPGGSAWECGPTCSPSFRRPFPSSPAISSPTTGTTTRSAGGPGSNCEILPNMN